MGICVLVALGTAGDAVESFEFSVAVAARVGSTALGGRYKEPL